MRTPCITLFHVDCNIELESDIVMDYKTRLRLCRTSSYKAALDYIPAFVQYIGCVIQRIEKKVEMFENHII